MLTFTGSLMLRLRAGKSREFWPLVVIEIWPRSVWLHV